MTEAQAWGREGRFCSIPIPQSFGYFRIFNVPGYLIWRAGPALGLDRGIVAEAPPRSGMGCSAIAPVALGLNDFAKSGRVFGRRQEFYPLSMGMGQKVTFWLPMILSIDEQASAIFIDPRRTKRLTADGRRFAFSMMNERIRAADEDFADVRLTIVQFGDPSDDRRAVTLHKDEGLKLFSREELEKMVASTYEMWREVLEEREVKARGRATGTGSLI